MPSIDLKYAFGLKPEKAIEYFKAKGFRITWDWHEMLESAHARAFTVAKVMRTDILQDIHAEITKALEQGQTFADWKKTLTPRLKAKGWWGEVVNEATGEVANVGPHRLRTIYETNIQTSYMVGRYQQMMENAADRPWWMYVAVMDKRTRPAHSALNGLVFRFDDPFWNSHYPPSGFRCRCSVRALTDARLKEKVAAGEAATRSTVGPNANATLSTVDKPLDREGKKMYQATTVKVTGLNGEKIAMAPDAGWSYNPGKAWQKPFVPPITDGSPGQIPVSDANRRLPLPAPAKVSRSLLMADGLAPEVYYAEFLKEFPPDVVRTGVFRDVTDEPVLVTEELFRDNQGNWKITKRDRHRSIRLLASTIIDPDEVWEYWKQRGDRGQELRRRYLKRFVFEEDGKDIPALAIFEKGKSGWVGETVYPVEQKTKEGAERYFEKMRGEVLRYRKQNSP